MPTQQRKKPKTGLDFRLDAEAQEVTAQEVLGRCQTITLSNQGFDAFLEAIESDEEPSDALKRAAERYQQRFGVREPLR